MPKSKKPSAPSSWRHASRGVAGRGYAVSRRSAAWLSPRGAVSVAFTALVTLVAAACGPRAHIPPRGPSPVVLPAGLAPTDSVRALATALAPVLYLQRDEAFPLERVVAAVHPSQRVIAYYLLWRDDVAGAWIPFTVPTDEEVVWVGYDATGAPEQVWTYWHGRILHTAWPRRQVAIDVQWGKHGSLPRGVRESDLPRLQTLNDFYAATIFGLPDIWLGDLNRKGPLCFCHGYARYRDFSRVLPLSGRLDAVVYGEDPRPVLKQVFGANYSRKTIWPWGKHAPPVAPSPAATRAAAAAAAAAGRAADSARVTNP